MQQLLTGILTSTTLKELLSALRDTLQSSNDEQDAIDRHMCELPVFGGTEPPGGTACVWSWDVDSLIVGTCISDFCIVSRAEHLASRVRYRTL